MVHKCFFLILSMAFDAMTCLFFLQHCVTAHTLSCKIIQGLVSVFDTVSMVAITDSFCGMLLFAFVT